MFCSRCGTEYQDNAKFCPSCGLDLAATTPLAAAVDSTEQTEIDQVRAALKDEYEIHEELGRGGMAIVFKAREKGLDRDVAVKVLPFSLAFDAEFVERFQREARTAAKLEHAHIISIYRVGKKGRVIYFVMKYLRGESLSEKLHKRGKLPPNEIRRILVQTASALGYAHKNEIVHRDIKPDNIMFDDAGNAILTDFGIAKAASGTRLTGTGMSIGTPHYMSPEQARAQKLDGRSDIYSLGVVAYQCLAGVVPFDGEDSFSIGYKHIMEDLPEPEMETAEQRVLYDIVERMMAKSPEDRHQTAEDLVAALERGEPGFGRASAASLSEIPTTVIPQGAGVPGTDQRPASPATPTTPMPRTSSTPDVEPKKKRAGVLIGVLLFLVLGGGGAGGYWYYFLDAEWPLPFFAPASIPDEGPYALDAETEFPPDSELLAGVDPLLFETADSSLGVSDTMELPELGGTPDTITADAVAAAEPEVSAADDPAPPVEVPNTGTLVVRTPPGGVLMIDGERVEVDSLELEPGTHQIAVEREGFERFVETVQVARGQTVIAPVTMVPDAQPARRAEQKPEPTGPTRPVPPPQNRAAVVDCATESPGTEYFRSSACFDSPPSPTSAPRPYAPPGYNGDLEPVYLVVRVGKDGNALRTIRQRRQEATRRLQIAAMRFAQDSLRYTPALKDGQTVEAWLRVTVQFRPSR